MIKQQILEVINKYSRFLISSHIHPEGDAIGSQLAMASLLRGMGKSVRMINSDPVPKNLAFLPGIENIENRLKQDEERIRFEAAVILDCAGLSRIGKVQDMIQDEYIINIDHHVSNDRFGNINWTDNKYSSAGEMVYGLFKSSNVELDTESALCLYVAIMTDTGSFRHKNTTSRTHQVVADLLNYDLDPPEIYERIYETKSFATMKLLGEVLSNLQQSRDGKVVWCTVTNEMLRRYELDPESTEDFIGMIRMTEGAEVIAFLRELPGEKNIKVSLRSKTDIDVNEIAKAFGGGGHPRASGCVIETDMAGAEKQLIRQIKLAVNRRAGA